ncbi:MAG: hypothetical protein CSB33_05565 [Desulfobacterales bacterium]|nr:MAG: hypothetical protein CSB33_05565 [Desulfobacterales bacterium]
MKPLPELPKVGDIEISIASLKAARDSRSPAAATQAAAGAAADRSTDRGAISVEIKAGATAETMKINYQPTEVGGLL